MAQLTVERLTEIAAASFADDLADEASVSWSEAEVVAFFESGGAIRPSTLPTPPAIRPSKLPLPPSSTTPLLGRPPLWWERATSEETVLASSYLDAHARSETISRVRLFHDVEGAVGEPGDFLALSGGWDCVVRVWRVSRLASSEPAEQLCELKHSDARWVYDLDSVGYIRDGAAPSAPPSLGVLASHTGGMVAEPNQLIRLWSVGRHRDHLAGACTMLVNTEGSTGDPRGYAHMRGVHALHCRWAPSGCRLSAA